MAGAAEAAKEAKEAEEAEGAAAASGIGTDAGCGFSEEGQDGEDAEDGEDGEGGEGGQDGRAEGKVEAACEPNLALWFGVAIEDTGHPIYWFEGLNTCRFLPTLGEQDAGRVCTISKHNARCFISMSCSSGKFPFKFWGFQIGDLFPPHVSFDLSY